MTLQSSGLISASDINLELGRVATAPFSLTGTEERALAGVPTGVISFSDFYGKSSSLLESTVITLGLNNGSYFYFTFTSTGTATPDVLNGSKITSYSVDSAEPNLALSFILTGLYEASDIYDIKVDSTPADGIITYQAPSSVSSDLGNSLVVMGTLPTQIKYQNAVTVNLSMKFNKKVYLGGSFKAANSGTKIGYEDEDNVYGILENNHDRLYYGTGYYRFAGLFINTSNSTITLHISHETLPVLPQNVFERLLCKMGASVFPSIPASSTYTFNTSSATFSSTTNISTWTWPVASNFFNTNGSVVFSLESSL